MRIRFIDVLLRISSCTANRPALVSPSSRGMRSISGVEVADSYLESYEDNFYAVPRLMKC